MKWKMRVSRTVGSYYWDIFISFESEDGRKEYFISGTTYEEMAMYEAIQPFIENIQYRKKYGLIDVGRNRKINVETKIWENIELNEEEYEKLKSKLKEIELKSALREI